MILTVKSGIFERGILDCGKIWGYRCTVPKWAGDRENILLSRGCQAASQQRGWDGGGSGRCDPSAKVFLRLFPI
jgi:hypothetical protein